MPMVEIKRSGSYIKFGTYLIAVVLINIAGMTLFYRLDLTKNRIYSISQTSKRVLSSLTEPLSIQVFFTKNLPAPHNNTERYLNDLLEEYAIYGNKYFNYRFYNVSSEEGDVSEESRENQKLANNYGIHPIQIQAIEKDEVKFQRVYMGLVLIHGDLIERIPTITSTDGLEYKLTTTIQKMNDKISALLGLSGNIQVKLYLSSSIETVAPYMGLKNLNELPDQISNLVAKLNRKNYDKLKFEYIDPAAEQDLDAVAKAYNIMTLSWPELAKGKVPAGKGAIGMVMEYGKKSVVIPLLQVIRLPILGTQYKLADMDTMEATIEENLESLIDINENIGYLADLGTLPVDRAAPGSPEQPSQESLNNFRDLVSQNYSFKPIRLGDEAIPKSLNCLVVVRPTEEFSDYDLYQIDQFLMQGKSLALFLDAFNEVQPANQPSPLVQSQTLYKPLNTGLQKLLEHYGVRIKKSYVMDENCFRQELPARLGGGDRPIYFAPIIKNQNITSRLKFMNNIKTLVALKISPLELIPDQIKANELNAQQLFASSDKSWEMKDHINLNPLFIKPPSSSEEQKGLPLAYLIEGSFPSYFAGKPIPVKEGAADDKGSEKSAEATATGATPEQAPAQSQTDVDISKITSQGQFLAKGRPGKLFLMASSTMLSDSVIDEQGQGPDATFILNLIDYLNNREDIAVMRSKEQRLNPLDETTAATKTLVKTINIAGLPVLVVLFGLAVWFRRHSRKKHIQMMFRS
jgi:ABC-type uncharacterized transport system involved in gliding motility auxiliary subunit